MRIIAGELRGRHILAPESDTTRPITDRAKQSLFDIITPLLPGACVYDCFSGTGSMGLESLSRGCDQALFFERDRSAIQLLRKNIQSLGVSERSRVLTLDIFRYFDATPVAQRPAELIFLDPPYRFLREQPDDLHRLARTFAAGHLAEGGIVVFRHDARDVLVLDGLECFDRRQYGEMAIEFLRVPGDNVGAAEQ